MGSTLKQWWSPTSNSMSYEFLSQLNVVRQPVKTVELNANKVQSRIWKKEIDDLFG